MQFLAFCQQFPEFHNYNNYLFMSTVLSTEEDVQIQNLALDRILSVVDDHWPEISNVIHLLEALFESNFPEKHKIAFILSKVYYHLEEYQESVEYALESQNLFDIKQKSSYVDQIISKGLESYISQKQEQFNTKQSNLNPKLENLFERIFQNAIELKNFKSALGVCLEARRIDKIQQIMQYNDNEELINYLYELSIKYTQIRNFRLQVLQFIQNIYKAKKLESHEYMNFCQCSYHLNDFKQVALTLSSLIMTQKQNQILLAFQIALDLAENENKYFSDLVIQEVQKIMSELKESNPQNELILPYYTSLISILNSTFTSLQTLNFLKSACDSDPLYPVQIKEKLDQKQSITHSALIFANSILNAGTTNDKFIKDNFEWAQKASHWARFNLVASMGVIHAHNQKECMAVLKPYLPSAQPGKFYEVGGSLMAIGFCYQKTRDQEMISYLLEQIKKGGANEVVIHGACQALGLITLGSEDRMIYEELKNVLFCNQAATGEASAMAIGLLMAGSGHKEIQQELLEYARETTHEKIIRSIGLALALNVFGKEENGEPLYNEMLQEQDAIIRYGGALAIGMSYCGTSHQKGVKRLLNIISTDVSDDVKRAAVMALGFVYIGNGQQLPQILKLLVQSYNPHIRYGAAMALGISSAGKGFSESLKMISPMVNDTVDFVRQGAMIANALILQQFTDNMDPAVSKFKSDIQEVWSKKQESGICKLGAILSAGILQPGGKNSVVSLTSKSSSLKIGACVGMLYFTHYWYWFTSVNFLSLALQPTAFIGVDKDLDICQQFTFISNSKPSLYGYPSNIDPNKEKEKKEALKINLSTTQKTNKRNLIRKNEDKRQEMVIEQVEKPKEPELIVEEPQVTILQNPCRILEKQQNVIQFQPGRYKPIMKNRTRGVVFLIDSQPEEKVKQISQKMEQEQVIEKVAEQPNQVPIPEDFIFEDTKETDRLL